MNFDETKEDEYRKIIFSKPENFKGFIVDDLETFLETLGEKTMNTLRTTCHITMMTGYEKRLLARKDQQFLESFFVHSLGQNPDVKKIEMDSSESQSKYVLSRCSRQTLILNNFFIK